ncbi:Pentatricopeptide repeat-containing protein [Senna tora]|uniref:Pentatricopeptide repeat-containing protein n=1 Tax=Senna tora TaxID=362788 RepID=A0A835CAQ7_9FABA|nr:Pentatricopeptide repeat-containing protein [Senna tora]
MTGMNQSSHIVSTNFLPSSPKSTFSIFNRRRIEELALPAAAYVLTRDSNTSAPRESTHFLRISRKPSAPSTSFSSSKSFIILPTISDGGTHFSPFPLPVPADTALARQSTANLKSPFLRW